MGGGNRQRLSLLLHFLRELEVRPFQAGDLAQRRSKHSKNSGELAGCYNRCAAMPGQREQTRPIASNQIVCLPRLTYRQEKVISQILRPLHMR